MALKVILKANSTRGLKTKSGRYSIMHLNKCDYTNINLERDGTYKKSLLVHWEYRNEGILPYIPLGGKVLYRESDLEELLERHYHPAYRTMDK